MPAPVNVLPDAELAVIQYLRARSEVTALVPADRITTTLPPKPTYPVVLIQRIGGVAPVWQRLDEPAIQVDVVGGSRYDCHKLARTVRACLMAIRNDTVTEGVLVLVAEEVALQWMPDMVPVPPLPRYTARFTVLLHP
jgi:hypothetical protein